MSRKLEIRTRMAELQKEYSSLNEELKAMEEEAKATAAREKYKDYAFKVGTYGYKVEPEEKIEAVSDADREDAGRGKSGLIYSGFTNGAGGFGFILMKDPSEYSRVVRVCAILHAVEHLASDNVKDKEPYIKVLLGEQ